MILAIDIGNTNIVLGCIENSSILFEARIATDLIKTSDQYCAELKNMMELHYSDADERKSCIPIYGRLAAAIGQGDTQEADAMMVKILDRAWASLSPVLTSDREDA